MKKRDRDRLKKQKAKNAVNNCQNCTACCDWITFTLNVPVSIPLQEYYTTRGCRIVKVDKVRTAIMVHTPCQHKSSVGCSIYKDRPRLCASYVGYADPLMANVCKLQHGGSNNGSKTAHNPFVNDPKSR